MPNVELNLAADRRGMTLKGSQDAVTFSTLEVEDLIRGLAGVRAAMVPPIPGGEPVAGTVAATAPNMHWRVRVDPAFPFQCQLWLLHPGLGWVAIPLGKPGVAQLVETLQRAHDAMQEIQ